MMLKFLCTGALLCVLGGCAAPVVPTLATEQLWQDAAFHYQPGQVVETAQSLFHVDPAVTEELRSHIAYVTSAETRVNRLLTALYDERGVRFAYAGGQTTGAMETWQSRQGDCMSLTILTYAMAKSLGIEAVMQQVNVAPVFDRRKDADFVSHHVNVYVPTRVTYQINGQPYESSGIVVDFQPQPGSNARGVALREHEMLARFYNNRAAEYLTQKNDRLAYAYYRAAIAADAHYGPAYGNLAQLYATHGFQGSAERLLWHAIALDKVSDVPMRNLHSLLVGQGRTDEAQKVSLMMERLKEKNPYHWLNIGVAALRQGKLRRAISALERAEELAIGFEEIHYNLAIAYARNGQRDKATQQIEALNAINHNDPNIAVLNKKLQGLHAKPV